ncbi:hypothetical protein [Nonomuraea wenchangensis]|uniref:hypothetical protein n=1 Tax=Nonomuraea wenchangensis TaxID=568860 RepID=UPI0037911B3C
MGRHRSDPMGLARMALAVVAAGALVTLLVIGARALIGTLSAPSQAERERVSAAATPVGEPDARVPTVRIECLAETCPTVTVRVPGGDVLQHREMSRGEEANYFEDELDVVVSDGGTVRVTENGLPRPQGEPGARQAFTVRAASG